jgi:hypothetical protein
MNRFVLKSRVGSNGVLQLTVPLSAADANQEVQIMVESVGPAPLTPDQWRRHIQSTAGSPCGHGAARLG